MPRLTVLLLLLVPGALLAQGFDSPLAPYPERRDDARGAEVEQLLAKLIANAPATGAFTATVEWSTTSTEKLDADPDAFGPLSAKSIPNWHAPPGGTYWPAGTYTISGAGTDFRIDDPEDEESAADWWQKDGEHTYSRAFSDRWPVIWRLHHDAFEAGMLGYCEGLGLLLWAFQPDEYLRRASGLAVGEPRQLGGRRYETLVATPLWMEVPRLLERAAEADTLSRWATHRPVVTYFVDTVSNLIVGAEFAYYRPAVEAANQAFEARPTPTGLVITCIAEEIQAAGSTRYPSAITAQVTNGGEVVRETVLSVRLAARPTALPELTLPRDRYVVDPWPQYTSERYAISVTGPEATMGDVIGLARAYSRSGDMVDAIGLLQQIVGTLDAGPEYYPARKGSVDWLAGDVVANLVERMSVREIDTWFDSLPYSRSWLEVVARGIRNYQLSPSPQKEKVEQLFAKFETKYEEPRRKELERYSWTQYAAFLEGELVRARGEGNEGEVQHIQNLLAEIQAETAKN